MRYDDAPIEQPTEDILNRSSVANKLAEAVAAYDRAASFVIGIQGKWGDGKTSFINMVLGEGLSDGEKILKDDNFLIVKFNPWYFTGDHQILKQFCGLLSEKLESEPNIPPAVRNAAKNIKKISAVVKPLEPVLNIGGSFLGVPILGTIAKNGISKAAEYATELEQAFQPSEDVVELKEKVSKSLLQFKKKILIVIDDIDRLNDEEIYEIFRLVKIIADFSNTIYLLSYDNEKVKAALPAQGYDVSFIDKIVQHEFDIPKIDEAKLSSFVDEGIAEIAKEYGVAIFDEDRDYYSRLNSAGLKDHIVNIRTAKRILNKLSFDFSCLTREVYLMDLLVLNVLKIYASEAYGFLSKKGDRYLNPSMFSEKENSKIYQNFKDKISSDQSWSIPLLEVLFPVLIGIVKEEEMAVKRRLCSEDHFKKYFQLTVPEGEISEFKYEDLIEKSKNYDEFFDELMKYQGTGEELSVLRGLRKRSNLFDKKEIFIPISVLLDVADFFNSENREFFGLAASDTAFYLALNLLNALPNERKENVFLRVVKLNKYSLSHLARFLDYVGQVHGHIPAVGQHTILKDEEKYLRSVIFNEAKKRVFDRIDQTTPDELIKRSNFSSSWFSLERLNYPNLDDLRTKILGIKDGLLKVVRMYTRIVISSDIGAYLKTNFDSLRYFLRQNKNNQQIISELEFAMKQSSDQKLIEELKTGIKNAQDQEK